MNTEQTPPEGGNIGGGISQEDRTMAMLAHILGIFTGFIAALIIWLIKKDQSPFINDQAKEALNFQIFVLILWVGASVIGGITCGIGLVLYPVVWVFAIVFCILAGLAANNGQYYRYPITIRLIK